MSSLYKVSEPAAAAASSIKVTDRKNELRMWVNEYNGSAYLHVQGKFDAPENKKKSYCFLTPENAVHLSVILEHALRKTRDFDEKLVGSRGKNHRNKVLFKRNSSPKNTAGLYVSDRTDDILHSYVTINDVEAFQKSFNEMYNNLVN